MTKNRVKYEDLPILPNIVAEAVCARVYTGSEWSMQRCPSESEIKKIEAKRLKMTPEEIMEFSEACDTRCKAAYAVKAEWFEKIVKAKDNSGRDMLYNWIAHWMSSYLMTRRNFMRSLG
jgi:hypothetical protein